MNIFIFFIFRSIIKESFIQGVGYGLSSGLFFVTLAIGFLLGSYLMERGDLSFKTFNM